MKKIVVEFQPLGIGDWVQVKVTAEVAKVLAKEYTEYGWPVRVYSYLYSGNNNGLNWARFFIFYNANNESTADVDVDVDVDATMSQAKLSFLDLYDLPICATPIKKTCMFPVRTDI